MENKNSYPTFSSTVLFVRDVDKSRHFYNVVLGQKIIMDFGRNVIFEGGLGIWDRDYALNLIFQKKISQNEAGTNSLEVYFESEDLDNLYQRLLDLKIKIIHSIQEQPWGQRVFRVFDFDNHIIEFAESMKSVVIRLDNQGFSFDEISKKSQMPIEFIQKTLQEK